MTSVLRALRARHPFRAATDLIVSPTYVPDPVNVSLDLLLDRAAGIWHISNGEPTGADFAVRAAESRDWAPTRW